MSQSVLAADPCSQADSVPQAVAACPLCGSQTWPWLHVPGDWRRPRVARSFALVWCDVCSYGLLSPRPESADLASFYDVDDYYTHHAPRDGDARRPLFERLRLALAWRADRRREWELTAARMARYGIRPPARLCDIGCGNGGLLKRMTAAGYDVVGIEPYAEAVRSAVADGLRVVRGSAESVPLELSDARFDAVTMMHVLEHTLDPAAAVRSAVELLAPGGTFIVETPNQASRGALEAGIAWRWLDVPRHLNFFTPDSLRLICERAGLEVVDVDYTGYIRQFDDEWIADEQEIRRRLTAFADPHATPLPPPNSGLRAALLLAQTCFTSDEAKYDSVRVVARKR